MAGARAQVLRGEGREAAFRQGGAAGVSKPEPGFGTLLAMEAHVAENVRVSKRDVDRVQKGILAGKYLRDIPPPQ